MWRGMKGAGVSKADNVNDPAAASAQENWTHGAPDSTMALCIWSVCARRTLYLPIGLIGKVCTAVKVRARYRIVPERNTLCNVCLQGPCKLLKFIL